MNKSLIKIIVAIVAVTFLIFFCSVLTYFGTNLLKKENNSSVKKETPITGQDAYIDEVKNLKTDYKKKDLKELKKLLEENKIPIYLFEEKVNPDLTNYRKITNTLAMTYYVPNDFVNKENTKYVTPQNLELIEGMQNVNIFWHKDEFSTTSPVKQIQFYKTICFPDQDFQWSINREIVQRDRETSNRERFHNNYYDLWETDLPSNEKWKNIKLYISVGNNRKEITEDSIVYFDFHLEDNNNWYYTVSFRGKPSFYQEDQEMMKTLLSSFVTEAVSLPAVDPICEESSEHYELRKKIMLQRFYDECKKYPESSYCKVYEEDPELADKYYVKLSICSAVTGTTNFQIFLGSNEVYPFELYSNGVVSCSAPKKFTLDTDQDIIKVEVKKDNASEVLLETTYSELFKEKDGRSHEVQFILKKNNTLSTTIVK